MKSWILLQNPWLFYSFYKFYNYDCNSNLQKGILRDTIFRARLKYNIKYNRNFWNFIVWEMEKQYIKGGICIADDGFPWKHWAIEFQADGIESSATGYFNDKNLECNRN